MASKPATVCFVSETGRKERPIHDGSVRYRCYHLADELAKFGIRSSVCSADAYFKAPHADYDVYVFHRPNSSRANFARTVDLLRSLDRVLIADYDDLIFGDVAAAMNSSAVKNATLTPEAAVRAFDANLVALRYFDKVTVSTTALAKWANHFHQAASTTVVHNMVPSSLIETHATLGTSSRRRPHTTIGYFAGTRSHDRDLPVVQDVLHRVLSENPDFQLLVVGPVAIPRGLSTLPNVLKMDVVNYWRLPYLMTRCSTVIAPLEAGAFNQCKSRVKFLEAALAGCHLVATPIPDMESLHETGIALPRNLDDWYECLSHPLRDEALMNARENALSAIRSLDSATAFLSIAET